jgi:predicted RNA-binding Zn-ribbon protein involved in translation (DUF1610 family)
MATERVTPGKIAELSMDVTFRCPKCEQTARDEVSAEPPHPNPSPTTDILSAVPGGREASKALMCRACGLNLTIPDDAFETDEPGRRKLTRCLACPSRDLFVRKDFPQRLGVAIVVLGFAASCVTWYYHWLYATFGILFATALIDLLLYFLCGNALMCYACGAIYRDASVQKDDRPFDLTVHERYRQQAIRMKEKARG